MSSQQNGSRDVSQMSRRRLLRTTGATIVGGTALAGVGAVTAAADSCSDLDQHVDCDHEYDDFGFVTPRPMPVGTQVEGRTNIVVANRGYETCDYGDCVLYKFDVVGHHEAFDNEEEGKLDSFGFRFTPSDEVIPDRIDYPGPSDRVKSGRTDPSGDNYDPKNEQEEVWLDMGSVLLGAGSLLYSSLGPAAFLYTVAVAADTDLDTLTEEVEFTPGNYIDAGAFAYYGLEFEVPDNQSGTVEFEGFTKTWNASEFTVGLKEFTLDQHLAPPQSRIS